MLISNIIFRRAAFLRIGDFYKGYVLTEDGPYVLAHDSAIYVSRLEDDNRYMKTYGYNSHMQLKIHYHGRYQIDIVYWPLSKLQTRIFYADIHSEVEPVYECPKCEISLSTYVILCAIVTITICSISIIGITLLILSATR